MEPQIKINKPPKTINRHCGRLTTGLSLVVLVLVASTICFSQAAETPKLDQDVESTAVSKYREPNWFVRRLMEFFDEIDWKAIELASGQVEKFIRSVEKVLRSFRIFNRDNHGGKGHPPDFARLFSGSWWNSNGKVSPSDAADSTNVKAMLERVACFVGYMRLLNHSSEALAELDAAKVVSNLFNASKKNSSLLGNLFG